MELPELAAVHDQYLTLCELSSCHFGGNLAGKLMLRAGFDAEGIATAVSASVAGAASLLIESDSDRLRQGLRLGFCDFVVSHLDEALRILKNELRRGRAVAVALAADSAACLRELGVRGLQPDLLSCGSLAAEELQIFSERGARLISAGEPDAVLSLVDWSVGGEAAKSSPAVLRAALGALDPSRGDTCARHGWLKDAPAFLGRAFGLRQCVRMTTGEISDFRDSLPVSAASITLRIHGFEAREP